MPVHRQKKFITTNTSDSTPVELLPQRPEQQEFRSHLRTLARGAIRIVLEDVMREELDAALRRGLGREQEASARAIAMGTTAAI